MMGSTWASGIRVIRDAEIAFVVRQATGITSVLVLPEDFGLIGHGTIGPT